MNGATPSVAYGADFSREIGEGRGSTGIFRGAPWNLSPALGDKRVAEDDVDCAQVERLLVDDRPLGSTQRMRPTIVRAESDPGRAPDRHDRRYKCGSYC